MNYFTLDQISEVNTLNEGEEKPARYAVIGKPVSHSLSPQLHQGALDSLDQEARYIRVEVERGQVAEAFEKLYAAGIKGINVTVPHKLEAVEAAPKSS